MDDSSLKTAIVAFAVVLLIPAYKRFQARLHERARIAAFCSGRAVGWLLASITAHNYITSFLGARDADSQGVSSGSAVDTRRSNRRRRACSLQGTRE